MVRSMFKEYNSLVQICVSTLNDGIFNIKFSDDFCYLIIHQVTNGVDYEHLVLRFPANVKYISLKNKGLSLSRNIALRNCDLPYCWIMDDDVEILSSASSSLNEIINRNPNQYLYVVSHSHRLENIEVKPAKKIGLFGALHISSIDMIINVRSTSSFVSFNENFGLGTDFPSGEEFIFANEVIRKKLGIVKVDTVCSIHPEESSGNDFFSTTNKLKAKRLMFIESVGRFFGNILYVFFILKKLPLLVKNNAILTVVRSFI
ncbi:glycosyltransferase [Vibrio vulnificus]|nr:glycosyltransferase [Vibrio vulnificus]